MLQREISYKKKNFIPFHLDELLEEDNVKDYIPLPISLRGSYYPRGFDNWTTFSKHMYLFNKVLTKCDNKAVVAFFGSSIQGYRFKRKDEKELWFNEKSDYDIIICSRVLFDKLSKRNPSSNIKKKCHNISNDCEDETILELNKIMSNWKRSTNIIVYKNVRSSVNNYILLLYIITNTDNKVVDTYLIGRDVINKRKIGKKKDLLSKML